MKRSARHRNRQCWGGFPSLLADVRGATAIEYGLILALITIVMIVALVEVADTTVGMWGNINTQVRQAN